MVGLFYIVGAGCFVDRSVTYKSLNAPTIYKALEIGWRILSVEVSSPLDSRRVVGAAKLTSIAPLSI